MSGPAAVVDRRLATATVRSQREGARACARGAVRSTALTDTNRQSILNRSVRLALAQPPPHSHTRSRCHGGCRFASRRSFGLVKLMDDAWLARRAMSKSAHNASRQSPRAQITFLAATGRPGRCVPATARDGRAGTAQRVRGRGSRRFTRSKRSLGYRIVVPTTFAQDHEHPVVYTL